MNYIDCRSVAVAERSAPVVTPRFTSWAGVASARQSAARYPESAYGSAAIEAPPP
jgi:hypothetical protein